VHVVVVVVVVVVVGNEAQHNTPTCTAYAE
jgi:hypothetical protein